MRRNTGAIFRETLPETIMTSAWRGLARKTSAPNRARSLRADVAFIISIAQHARPKVAGQSDDLRAQLIIESSRVVKTSGNASAIMFSSPIKSPFGSGCSLRCRHVTLTNILERTGFGFGFATGAFAPVKGAFFNDVNVSGE